MRQKDPGNIAVRLAHPKTVEYQVVRTSLLPGVLKTLKENKKHSLPIKVFEVGDTAIKDDTQERRSRNVRKVCATYSNKTSGLEQIHGLLDRTLQMLHCQPVDKNGTASGYWIQDSESTSLPLILLFDLYACCLMKRFSLSIANINPFDQLLFL